jgi:putative ATPase
VQQDFLPEKIKDKSFYKPQHNPSEDKILERLKAWWKNRF